MLAEIKSRLKFLIFKVLHGVGAAQELEERAVRAEIRARQPGNLCLAGFKVYSQSGEDGIIAEIFSRIPHRATFIEIGTANGCECNSHLLLLKGWRGIWVEGSARCCADIRARLGLDSVPGRFNLSESFVRKDNIVRIYREGCGFLGVDDVDFLSLDIDGNDLHILDTLLASGARPAVLCVEYNAKFPPPVSLNVEYRDDRVWQNDDYMGASLQAFADLLLPRDYLLVTCDILGVNAFFVRKDLAEPFDTFTPAEAWQPLRLYLSKLQGHNHSLQYLRDVLHRPIESAPADATTGH